MQHEALPVEPGIDILLSLSTYSFMSHQARRQSSTGHHLFRSAVAIVATVVVVGVYLSVGYPWFPDVAVELLTVGGLALFGYNVGMGISSWLARRQAPRCRLPRYRLPVAVVLLIIATAAVLPIYLDPPSSGHPGDIGAALAFVGFELLYAVAAPLVTAMLSVLILDRLTPSSS